jgi:hypothetical protein
MPNSSSIPHDDASRSILLKQLSAQLPSYAITLDLTSNEITKIASGSAWFDYLLNSQEVAQNYSQSIFSLKRILRDGPANTDIAMPTSPALPTPPTDTPYSDIFGFVGPMITRIKKHPNYTEAIGKTLGIIAAATPVVDTTTLQPILSVDLQGGHPVISWKSNGTDALEIEADHGTGTFSLLTIRMSSGYQDNTPLPAPGSAIVWKYRAIYHKHDQQIGHWSQVLEISVKGI